MRDPFEVLGLPRRPWLEEADIQSAFFKRIAGMHPDQQGGDAGAFGELTGALHTISHTGARLMTLAGDISVPVMPPDFDTGVRLGELSRRSRALADNAQAATNAIARAMIVGDAIPLRDELTKLTAAVEGVGKNLEDKLRALDARWPDVAAEELAALAGEFRFFQRWDQQIRDSTLALDIIAPPPAA
jgi:hypothetical protein